MDSVVLMSNIKPSLVELHLDDVLGIGSPLVWQEGDVDQFLSIFKLEADRVGFRRDTSLNREKNQEPATTVVALGIHYDTVNWTWGYNEDRLALILRDLARIEAGELITKQDMERLTGKLVAVRFLVEGGHFYVDAMYKSMEGLLRKDDLMVPVRGLWLEARWWRIALMVARDSCAVKYPEAGIPGYHLMAWSDAAGGTWGRVGTGLGVVFPAILSWAYLPWPAWLQHGGMNDDGVRFSDKLPLLEGMGPLVAVVLGGKVGMGRTLLVMVDNQGTVSVFGKGRCRKCHYSTTIARATYEVARGLGMEVRVCKIRRCSDKGSTLADSLSKGKVEEFKRDYPDFQLVDIPKPIWDWISRPKVDYSLGRRILQAMQTKGIRVKVKDCQ